MARVVIVPGLAVRTYAEPAVAAVAARGHRVDLAPAPAWRGSPADLERYGTRLARRLEQVGPVDLLVGLSVGTQAAAAGAVDAGPTVRRLLLVSPTVDPVNRSWGRLLGRWVRGDPRAADPPLREQAADWTRAGVPRIVAGLRSALRTAPLERLVPAVDAEVVVAHAEFDPLGRRSWAAGLAGAASGRLIDLAGAPHSWPYHDTTAFADLVEELIR